MTLYCIILRGQAHCAAQQDLGFCEHLPVGKRQPEAVELVDVFGVLHFGEAIEEMLYLVLPFTVSTLYQLAQFMVDGPDPASFERIKMQIRAREIYALDSVRSLAERYGDALTSGLTLDDVRAWPDVLQAVTPEDVMRVAGEVLDMRASVTGWLMPETAPETGVETTEEGL